MNIYLTEYYHLCGKYKAVIIAKDEEGALKLFKEYFDIPTEHSKIVKLGNTHLSRSKVLITESN